MLQSMQLTFGCGARVWMWYHFPRHLPATSLEIAFPKKIQPKQASEAHTVLFEVQVTSDKDYSVSDQNVAVVYPVLFALNPWLLEAFSILQYNDSNDGYWLIRSGDRIQIWSSKRRIKYFCKALADLDVCSMPNPEDLGNHHQRWAFSTLYRRICFEIGSTWVED